MVSDCTGFILRYTYSTKLKSIGNIIVQLAAHFRLLLNDFKLTSWCGWLEISIRVLEELGLGIMSYGK